VGLGVGGCVGEAEGIGVAAADGVGGGVVFTATEAGFSTKYAAVPPSTNTTASPATTAVKRRRFSGTAAACPAAA